MTKAKIRNISSIANELKDMYYNSDSNNIKIGVVVFANTNDKNCYALDLASSVKKQIIKNGVEVEVITLPHISERFKMFLSENYVASSYKKLVANLLELVLHEKELDGVVFIPNGFNSTIASIISSIRLNLPTIVLPIGFSKEEENKNLLDILSLPGKIAIGEKSVFDYQENIFCEYSGSGATLSSENIFNIILEFLELSPKGSSSIYAQTYEKLSQTRVVADQIVEIVKKRLPLKKMINKKSINNALILNSCLGGNPSILNAISDICKEASLELDFNKTLNLSKSIPVMFNTYLGIKKFIEFGGLWALVKAMIKENLIDGNYKTFAETTLIDETKSIKDYSNFVDLKKESLFVLRGNIAEKFALAKSICVNSDNLRFEGKALVFENDDDACSAVLNKVVEDNNIIVINNCGKDTNTGLSTISQTALALKSMNKTNIIISDGCIAEDISVIGISFVSPDSKDGNIKLLKDGDNIEIDFIKGKINADVGSKEFTLRQKKYISEHKILPKYFNN